MDTTIISFPITDYKRIKQQVLSWANQYDTCCFLDNHQYALAHHRYECIAGIGSIHSISVDAGSALAQLETFREQHPGWLFGHLSYDLKNETGDHQSQHMDRLGFPDLFFFVPQIVLLLGHEEIEIHSNTVQPPEQIFHNITDMQVPQVDLMRPRVRFTPRMPRQAYIDAVQKLQAHILRGDCYEVNFCQEFFAENVELDPLQVYRSLAAISPSPFAAFYKRNGSSLACASPERFLRKEGNSILSQPIKGTAKRNLQDLQADAENRAALQNSSKDRSENVMVVDLVRNDLSRICEEGTVQVEELFGVYAFPQVHQMISTIKGKLRDGLSFSDIIASTFPMGSMTGAPKEKVVELIEAYEWSRRGLFSGAVGYIRPDGDFDFNVVIRSLLYNEASGYLSYQVGSGITFYSDAEDEYEECLLKAAAIRAIFDDDTT